MKIIIVNQFNILVFWTLFDIGSSIQFDNVTGDPASRQLYDFRVEHPMAIGVLTTSSGEPVEIRDTFQLNSDQFSNQYHLDLHTTFDAERIRPRVVHAKGVGAYGFFTVTNDVTNYTNANVFSQIGKKTPIVSRFSISPSEMGGSDVSREFRGMAVKFYTEDGNLDLLCLQTPVFFFKDPILFSSLVRVFKRNPKSTLIDPNMTWDFVTLRPEMLNAFLWLQSDFAIPNGYRKMDAFPIHVYELSNKNGDKHYVRFNFRSQLGVEFLTSAQAAAIQGIDLDYGTRDLYNAINRGEYPSWRLEMDVMIVDNLKKLDYDPFDVTRLWKNGTYTTVQIGLLTLDRLPDNMFSTIELNAFNPANLVPGIPGPVDTLFKGRRIFYRDTQNYRLGTNHNKILVNLPNYAKTYVRDGVPPVNENMKDAPNYYPNSYSGPMPYVDETRPDKILSVLEPQTVDFQISADFYNNVLVNDTQRQRLTENLIATLVPVEPSLRTRSVQFLYLIDQDLGKRVDIGLQAALLASG